MCVNVMNVYLLGGGGGGGGGGRERSSGHEVGHPPTHSSDEVRKKAVPPRQLQLKRRHLAFVVRATSACWVSERGDGTGGSGVVFYPPPPAHHAYPAPFPFPAPPAQEPPSDSHLHMCRPPLSHPPPSPTHPPTLRHTLTSVGPVPLRSPLCTSLRCRLGSRAERSWSDLRPERHRVVPQLPQLVQSTWMKAVRGGRGKGRRQWLS